MGFSSGRYDWERARRVISHIFSDKLSRGEHVVIWENKSEEIFGRSIARANACKIDLDIQEIPPLIATGTICYHLAKMGYSNRVGSRKGKKYVEIWLPKTD
ncbi:MAG: hypothetical protein ACFE7E_08490 [Candidatus Hodarchaeota archaeon]